MNYNLVPFCLLLQTCATMMNMYPLIKKGADYNNCKETTVLFLTELSDEYINVYTLSVHNLCAQSDYSFFWDYSFFAKVLIVSGNHKHLVAAKKRLSVK